MTYDLEGKRLTLHVAEHYSPVEIDLTGDGYRPNTASLHLLFPDWVSASIAEDFIRSLKESDEETRASLLLEKHLAYLDHLQEGGFFHGFFHDTEYFSSDLEKGMHRARLHLWTRRGELSVVGSANLWADRSLKERRRCVTLRGLFLGFCSEKADVLAQAHFIIRMGYDGFEANAWRACRDFARLIN
jgi:hypothetical protein